MKSLYPDVIHCAMAYSLRQRHDAASVSRAMCAAHESAVHCSVLQRVATCFSVLQGAAGVCATLLYCADTLLLCYESFNRASAMPHLNAIHTCHPHSQHFHVPLKVGNLYSTGWPRPTGCLMSWVAFHPSATNYRAILQKITHNDKASYASLPPCIMT